MDEKEKQRKERIMLTMNIPAVIALFVLIYALIKFGEHLDKKKQDQAA
jgi:hypothetical protein